MTRLSIVLSKINLSRNLQEDTTQRYYVIDTFVNPPKSLGNKSISELKQLADDLALDIAKTDVDYPDDYNLPEFDVNNPKKIIEYLQDVGEYKISKKPVNSNKINTSAINTWKLGKGRDHGYTGGLSGANMLFLTESRNEYPLLAIYKNPDYVKGDDVYTMYIAELWTSEDKSDYYAQEHSVDDLIFQLQDELQGKVFEDIPLPPISLITQAFEQKKRGRRNG